MRAFSASFDLFLPGKRAAGAIAAFRVQRDCDRRPLSGCDILSYLLSDCGRPPP